MSISERVADRLTELKRSYGPTVGPDPQVYRQKINELQREIYLAVYNQRDRIGAYQDAKSFADYCEKTFKAHRPIQSTSSSLLELYRSTHYYANNASDILREELSAGWQEKIQLYIARTMTTLTLFLILFAVGGVAKYTGWELPYLRFWAPTPMPVAISQVPPGQSVVVAPVEQSPKSAELAKSSKVAAAKEAAPTNNE